MEIRSSKEFAILLQYYIACLMKEDALALTFDPHREGALFYRLPMDSKFLSADTHILQLPVEEKLSRFFAHGLGTKQLYYAAPVIVDREGKLLPAFMQEVDGEADGTAYRLTPRSSPVTLNLAVLCTNGFTLEESQQIRTELEGMTFDQACETLAQLLKLPVVDAEDHETKGPRICRQALLFFGEKTGMTSGLIRELMKLQDRPLDDLASSALYSLLTDDARIQPCAPDPMLLEVFLMNSSQQKAVTSALRCPLTLITGPPGTGKSQVVLNILANAVMQNQTVCFASKNNKAVDVVVDKMNAILPRRLAIRMGHRSIRQKTAEDCKKLFSNLLLPSLNANTEREYAQVSSALAHARATLEAIATVNNELDDANRLIDTQAVQLPAAVFSHWHDDPLLVPDLSGLEADLHRYFPESEKKWGFPRLLIKGKQQACYQHYLTSVSPQLQASCLAVHEDTPEAMGTTLRHLATLHHLQQQSQTLQRLTTRLQTSLSVPSLLKETIVLQKQRQTLSRTLLNERWLRTLHRDPQGWQRHLNAFFELSMQLESRACGPDEYASCRRLVAREFRQILPALPVWVVTNLSAKRSFPFENGLFDLLIIDEASQCDIPSAIPLLYRAKRVVVIGDPNQLSHVSLLNHSEDRRLAMQNKATDLFDDYSYTRHSLYEFFAGIMARNAAAPILLNEHYRCHRDIITFSNTFYYGNQLSILTSKQSFLSLPRQQRHLSWHDVKGRTTPAASPYNEPEADACIEILTKLLSSLRRQRHVHPSIGVVTLFRAHADLIAEKIAGSPTLQSASITVGTAHRFQGDERDIILISPGVSTGIKQGTLYWVWTTRQLLNVAVSRARSYCIIVGDKAMCAKTTGPLADLSSYADALSRKTILRPSKLKKALLQNLTDSGLPFAPSLHLSPVGVDLVLTINGRRYAIFLGTTPVLTQDQHQENNLLREQGWRPRRYALENEADCTRALEEIQRLY